MIGGGRDRHFLLAFLLPKVVPRASRGDPERGVVLLAKNVKARCAAPAAARTATTLAAATLAASHPAAFVPAPAIAPALTSVPAPAIANFTAASGCSAVH